MSDLPWGVFVILGIGLVGVTAWIYYILKLSYDEMKDEEE